MRQGQILLIKPSNSTKTSCHTRTYGYVVLLYPLNNDSVYLYWGGVWENLQVLYAFPESKPQYILLYSSTDGISTDVHSIWVEPLFLDVIYRNGGCKYSIVCIFETTPLNNLTLVKDLNKLLVIALKN